MSFARGGARMPGWAEKHDNDAAATPKGATPKQIVSAEQRKLREDAAKAAAAEVEPLAVLSQAEQENAAPNDTAVAQAHVPRAENVAVAPWVIDPSYWRPEFGFSKVRQWVNRTFTRVRAIP